MHLPRYWTVAAGTLILATAAGFARAEQSSEGILGDWGGLRPFLADHGVDLELSYINEAATKGRGGLRREAQDAEQIYFGGSLDLQRIFAVPDAIRSLRRSK
jgi:porin